MSNLLQKIKSLFGKLKNKKVSYDRGGINPNRQWKIILSTTFIILCFLALIAFYFYSQIDKGNLFTVTSDSAQSEIKIDGSLLKKTVDDINARQAMNYNVRNDGVFIPNNPSL